MRHVSRRQRQLEATLTHRSSSPQATSARAPARRSRSALRKAPGRHPGRHHPHARRAGAVHPADGHVEQRAASRSRSAATTSTSPTRWRSGSRPSSSRSPASPTPASAASRGSPEELIIIDRQKAADMKLTVSPDRQHAPDGAVGHAGRQLPRGRRRVSHPRPAQERRAAQLDEHPRPDAHQRRRPAGRPAQRRERHAADRPDRASSARTRSASSPSGPTSRAATWARSSSDIQRRPEDVPVPQGLHHRLRRRLRGAAEGVPRAAHRASSSP